VRVSGTDEYDEFHGASIGPDGSLYAVGYTSGTGGDVSGTIRSEEDFAIGKFKLGPIPVSKPRMAANPTDLAWTGRQLKPDMRLTLYGETLKNRTDYTLSHGTNRNIGTGTITIIGKGSFTGRRTFKFDIVPTRVKDLKTSTGKGTSSVEWKRAAAAQKVSGYQVQHRLKGSARWTTASYPARTSNATIKKAKKGKQYEFRVRSYKKILLKRYYSAWSVPKTTSKVR
jgi:hypothetical protein